MDIRRKLSELLVKEKLQDSLNGVIVVTLREHATIAGNLAEPPLRVNEAVKKLIASAQLYLEVSPTKEEVCSFMPSNVKAKPSEINRAGPFAVSLPS
jgi:hypothetical protein